MADRKTAKIEFEFAGKDAGATTVAKQVEESIKATVESTKAMYGRLYGAMKTQAKAAQASAEANVAAARATLGGDDGVIFAARARATRMAAIARESADKVAAEGRRAVGSLGPAQIAALKEVEDAAQKLMAKGLSKARAYAQAYADLNKGAKKPFDDGDMHDADIGSLAHHQEAAKAHRERRDALGSEQVRGLVGLKAGGDFHLAAIGAGQKAAIEGITRAHEAAAAAAERNRAANGRAAKSIADYARSMVGAAKQVFRGANEMAEGVITMVRRTLTILRALHRGFRALVRGVHHAVRAITHLVHAAAHLTVSVGRGFLRGAVGGVRALTHAVLGAVRAFGRLAAKAGSTLAHVAKRAIQAALVLKGLETAGGLKLVKGAQAAAVERRDQVMEAANSISVPVNNDKFSAGYGRATRYATDVVQQVDSMAKVVGADPKAFAKTFQDVGKVVADAAAGLKTDQVALLKSVGVNALDGGGRARPIEVVMRDLTLAMQKLPADMRSQVVEKVFGGDANALRMLQAAAIGQQQTGDLARAGRERQQRLGNYLDPKDLVMLGVFKAHVQDLKDAWQGVYFSIARRVVPILDELSRRATAYLATYRTSIADVVGSWFLKLATNAVHLVQAIEREVDVFSRAQQAVGGYVRESVSLVQRLYNVYEITIKPMLPWMHFWLVRIKDEAVSLVRDFTRAWQGKSVHHEWVATAVAALKLLGRGIAAATYIALDLDRAIEGKGGARHFAWVDGFVAKVRGAMNWVRMFWRSVVMGDETLAEGTRVRKLAEWRNAVVSYVRLAWADVVAVLADGAGARVDTVVGRMFRTIVVYARQAWADIRAVWAGGSDAGVDTFVGRVAQWIAYVAANAPAWWETIKQAFTDGLNYVKAAWHEFMVVLGDGPGARGTSTSMPWINDLVSTFDTIKTRVGEAIDFFKGLYSAAQKVFGLFGLDAGQMLFFLSLAKWSGILGLATGAFTLLGGVLRGVLGTIGLIVTGLGTGGIAGALARLAGMLGIGGAGAAAAGLGAAEAGAGAGLGMAGAGLAVAAAPFVVPAAVAAAGAYGGYKVGSEIGGFLDDAQDRKTQKTLQDERFDSFAVSEVAEAIKATRNNVRENYLYNSPETFGASLDHEANKVGDKTRGYAENVLHIKFNGETVAKLYDRQLREGITIEKQLRDILVSGRNELAPRTATSE